MIRTDRAILIGISLLVTISMLFLLPELRRKTAPSQPPTVVELAASLRNKPADWLAFSRLAEHALDTTLPARIELWRSSYRHAHALAPLRANPATGFVRGGLFHWYELGTQERDEVKAAAAPLLRDGAVFPAIYASLFGVTGDFELLASNNPGRLHDLLLLRDLAVANGLFERYRALRDAATRRQLLDVQSVQSETELPQLIASLPTPLGDEHRPLVQALLEHLKVRPSHGTSLNPQSIGALIDFVIRRQMKPLDGLEVVTLDPSTAPPTERARLALALGNLDAASEIRVGNPQPDAIWRQYYIERAVAQSVRNNLTAAEADLLKASGGVLTAEVLDVAARIARGRGDETQADAIQRRLAQQFTNGEWSGLCGEILCRTASSTRYFATPTLQLRFRRADSGGIDPYVEVRVDGRRVNEGPVRDSVWEIPVGTGVHAISVTIINPGPTTNQRGVRMS